VREAIIIIWRLSVLAELILAARLLLQGLGGVYPALLTASCVFAFRSSLLILSVTHSRPMREVWKVTQPVDLLLCCWIVFELFSKWTRSYPGIGRFGRFLLGALILVAVLISLVWCPFEWKSLVFDDALRIYYILDRVVSLALAVFMLSVWLFFRNYPAAVAPNVVRHTHVTVIYFAISGLNVLAFTLNGLKVGALVNLSIVAVTVGCFGAWAFLLTRKGEDRASLPTVSPEDAIRIEKVNQELLILMKNFPK
jgi:hypothetical protein